MKNIPIFIIVLLLVSCEATDQSTVKKEEFRDPYRWPFAATSIWNMPIGSDAEYVPAEFEPRTRMRMTIDEDCIVMKPNAPMMSIYYSNAGWDRTRNRCEHNGSLLFKAPVPPDWVISPDTWEGLTPNSGLAVLMPDGETIKQTQPFAHCEEGDTGTSTYVCKDVNIYGDGITGAHGGSCLSAIGGALRYDELTPGSGPIRHALKVNVYAAKNLYYDTETKGYRWPASAADSYASSSYGKKRTIPPCKDARMGALLALPASLDISTLELKTEPARILAQAFQDYGAYIADDTAWDVYAIITEWGPDGRFKDEFKKNWGFDFSTEGYNDWGKDLDKIFSELHIVVNNSASSIGGGGTPRKELVPPFMPR